MLIDDPEIVVHSKNFSPLMVVKKAPVVQLKDGVVDDKVTT